MAKKYRYYPRVGDIITTSGTGFISGAINVGTFGVPYWHASHVGIITDVDHRRLIVESTSVHPLATPCEYAQVPVKGVQLHTIEDVVARPGRAWAHPIARPLYSHEAQRLRLFLFSRLGHPYDLTGALRSAGFIFNAFQSVLRAEDLATLFCSELVASALDHIGFFPVKNASRWNPNKLVRALYRAGLYHRRFELHPGMFPPTPRQQVVSPNR